MAADPHGPVERALASLDGLSVGDAFGEALFFGDRLIEARTEPAAPWRTTDDTEMAVAIVDILRRGGRIDEDALARAFAARFRADPFRGYGPGARAVLARISTGTPWREAAGEAFGGGSMGNGAAMRVAPLGAYFADDLSAAVDQARRSAVVTHAHPDGQAGATAVAVAAAWLAGDYGRADARALFEAVLDATPAGPTRSGIERAAALSFDAEPLAVALEIGAGWKTLCADTVPFCLWVAARHLDDFVEALWTTFRCQVIAAPSVRSSVASLRLVRAARVFPRTG